MLAEKEEMTNFEDRFVDWYTDLRKVTGFTRTHKSTSGDGGIDLIMEAKGKVTDIFGNEQSYNRRIKGSVMSNGILHEELIKITRLLRSP
jgi:hypothetical protein